MGCIACGKELAVNAKFCKHCGTSQAKATASLESTSAKTASANACAKCGVDIAETAKFCRACGTPRTSTATPPPSLAQTALYAPTEVIPPKSEQPLATEKTPKEPTPTTQAPVAAPPDVPKTSRETELSSVVKPLSVPKAKIPNDTSRQTKTIDAKQTTESSDIPQATASSDQTVTSSRKSSIALVSSIAFVAFALVGIGAWIWSSKQQTDTQIAELKKKAEEEVTARKRLEQEASKSASKAEGASQKDAVLNAATEHDASEKKASEEYSSKTTKQNEAQSSAAPSTLVTCLNTDDCYSATLLAMSKNDIDTVRRIAEKIDAFEKPARGNRTVARKLNEEGLSAFRKDDFSQASALLTKAQREDPSDVEIASNLGSARVKAADYSGANEALIAALLLNPRRTSTWIPIAELIARRNQNASDAVSALLIAYEWSTGKEKAIEYYTTQSNSESNPRLKSAFGEALKRIVR